jgi:hypothetical protein
MVLSRYLLAGTEENYERSQTGLQVSGTDLNPEPLEYEAGFCYTDLIVRETFDSVSHNF